MQPKDVVLLPPMIRQNLRLGHAGEQHGVQGLITEPTVERSTILTLWTWFDVDRGGAVLLAPAFEAVRNY